MYTLSNDGIPLCDFRSRESAIFVYKEIVAALSARSPCFSAQLNAKEHCALFSHDDGTLTLSLSLLKK